MKLNYNKIRAISLHLAGSFGGSGLRGGLAWGRFGFGGGGPARPREVLVIGNGFCHYYGGKTSNILKLRSKSSGPWEGSSQGGVQFG